ncbi:hypothetical protein M316_0064 [Nitrincola phage 1M3-16]|uniref:hypothetical protein n=1 Tax=Nitrincola phage 1M3-16 TaxID=1472912 RepID=UPI000444CB43|nr:hypothetical protein GJ22_gp088 [Nitrincola phage 1M3-16]AHX01129.1 hypothetical protein M316_0064 [Nitrincola phage 1M3-16]
MRVLEEKVIRDELGHWGHSSLENFGDDEFIPFSWFHDQGLEIRIISFEYDAPESLQDHYWDTGDPNVSDWKPTKPEGSGWFIYSITDTEDGPICAWVRHCNEGETSNAN